IYSDPKIELRKRDAGLSWSAAKPLELDQRSHASFGREVLLQVTPHESVDIVRRRDVGLNMRGRRRDLSDAEADAECCRRRKGGHTRYDQTTTAHQGSRSQV